MSTLISPPPPRSEDPHDAEALEALIEEARRRARRRRRGYAALALVAVAGGLLGFFLLDGGGGSRYCRGRRRGQRPDHRRQVAACVRPGGRNHHGARRRPPGPGHRLRSNDPGRRLQERGRWSHVAIAESPFPDGPAGRHRHRARGPGDPVSRHRARRGQDDGRGSFLAVDGLGSCRKAKGGEGYWRGQEGFVYTLVVDPRDPDIVYAGTWNRGVLKSTDGGASWRRTGSGR